MASLEQGLYIGLVEIQTFRDWFPNFWPDKFVMKVAGSDEWWIFELRKALIFYSVYLFKTYYVS